jgi:N-acetylmuramoyl-L-alanine amidase
MTLQYPDRMKRLVAILPFFLVPVAAGAVFFAAQGYVSPFVRSEAESDTEAGAGDALASAREVAYAGEKRPTGPIHVALQAGHWQEQELPDELANLRQNGAVGGGKHEWEVTLRIAQLAKPLLEAEGVKVDILPATIPPKYRADVFVSIHADENPDIAAASGYKVAAPSDDQTGRAPTLAELLEVSYGDATGLPLDPNVTDNMREYYAFDWQKYEHSLDPQTVSAIVETGFLTSAHDRAVIVRNPEKAAKGIADGIIAYLKSEGLLEMPSPLKS